MPDPSKHPTQGQEEQESVGAVVFNFLASFGLASVLFIILLILTWLGTLEQVEKGIYYTVKKYFSIHSFIIFPEITAPWSNDPNAEPIKWPIPLPGAFWVSVLLFVNMLCGGIIRARKGWKTVGVLISHSGILMLLVGAAITHLKSQRGNIALYPEESADVAESYQDWSIEILEVVDGEFETIQVIDETHLAHLGPSDRRLFKLSEMPFDLEIMGYQTNTNPVSVSEMAPRNGERLIDNYYLDARENAEEAERNLAGCYARPILKDGTKGDPFILAGASYYPLTLDIAERKFIIALRKSLWLMPFITDLNEFDHEFYPGTSRPKYFKSRITRHEGEETPVPVLIQMNEPMRYQGYTFFQASYGPPNARPGDRLYSVFEVVKDPADKWPAASLWVVSFGMLVHFGMMLFKFTSRAITK